MVLRFRQTFRERQMEWALATGSTGWGAILIENQDVFDRPFYQPLARMFPAAVWGWGMFGLGLLGLIVLFINGAWQRTPLLRQCSSGGRTLAWAGLLFSALSVTWQTPGAMIYATMLAMEIMALANATADGQRIKSGALAHGH